MRIRFESSGGFANLLLNYQGDTNDLPREQAEELLNLVKSSGVFDLAESEIRPQTAEGPPDVISYRLTLSDGQKQKTLTFNDVTAPAAVRPLLTLLRKLAVEQKRNAR
jgi:hypothetical protein